MSRQWPYLPRCAESVAILTALGDRLPVVLIGPAGIGKTTLTRAALTESGRSVGWVIGSASARATAFAALTPMVHIDGTGDVRGVLAALTQRLAEDDAVLAVEGADQLDAASATVLAQLVRSGDCPGMVVMTRSPDLDALDHGLVSALSAARAERVVLPRLSVDEVSSVVGDFLGAPLDFADIVRIHEACAGNPFYVRHLVSGSAAAGVLERRDDGTFVLASEFTVSPELDAIVGDSIDAATPNTRKLLEFLGILAPLPVATVSALGLDGAVEASPPDLLASDGSLVFPAHAIIGEVIRGRLGTLRRAQLTTELVAAMDATTSSAVEVLHRARLADDIGLLLPAQTNLEAAATAFNHGQFELSERLAFLSAAADSSPFARCQQVRAVAAQGEGIRAQRLLDEIVVDELDEAGLATYLVTSCVHFSTALGEHDRSLALLDTLGPRITLPSLQGATHAMRAMTSLHAGRQVQALVCARACMAGEWDGMVWAALARSVEAEVLRRLGETRRPVTIAEDALRMSAVAGPLLGIGPLRTLTLAHISEGSLGAAGEVADRFANTVALQSLPRAVAGASMAAVAVAEGRFGKAQRLAVDCLHALPDNDRSGLGRGVAALLAGVRALTGDAEGTRWAQRRCESMTLRSGTWSDVNPMLCEGFTRAAAGELAEPIARFRAAAELSFANHQDVDGIACLYWAVRFGDRDAARQLCDPRYRGEGVVADLMAAHARALLNSDATGMRRVSDSFAELGFIPYAADALAHAMVAFRRNRSPRDANELVPRLARLRRTADDFLSPAILAAGTGVVLSPRELEIYSMTESGYSRTDVAETLGLRPSTVTAYRSRIRERLSS
ncbi:MAG: LuxR C-terminal-related transcriptional regulator [Gordonia amarae]